MEIALPRYSLLHLHQFLDLQKLHQDPFSLTLPHLVPQSLEHQESSFSSQSSVDRATLLKHIKTAAVFARDGSGIINLEVETAEIVINAESTKLGTHKSRVPAKVEGDKVEIAYNYRYIEEFLNVVSGEDILLEFTNSAAAGVFRDVKEKNYLHLIMPVRS